ncbi:MAG: sigma 54-interacting transcriptional regulator [Desulfarculaceae bacterium]|nr:sigma 54-interacting transcriptional regulator [Desulfarculaceae bacterium]
MLLDFDQIAPLRQLLESAHNGVVVVDRDGFIVVYNQAARTLAGFTLEDVMGRHLGELSTEAWADMRRIIASGQPQVGRKVRLTESTIIANRTAIRDGGEIIGVLSIFQDVSEYESLADQLAAYKELSEQLDVIIESSHDGLWISDAVGKVIKVNAASAKGTGLGADKLVGRNVENLVAEGFFDRSATLEVLASRAPVTFVQNQRDGGQCLVTGTPVFNDEGEVRLVVINARDLTELNRLQAELEESRLLTQQYRSELSLIHLHQDLASQVIMRAPVMMRAFDTAMRVAQVDSSVLLAGESGVGKGLFAKLIHEASPRKEGPLVRVDCGGIPANLIEAELFGYERGAFTGALESGKLGYFELAQGGTLLLDEVGELPLSVQAKLLRFLEDNEVVRVGSTTPRRIDVRIIAATNRDLDRMVAEHQFRQDLYFRLKVVPLHLPPLRERGEDVPLLVHHFLKQFNAKCATDKVLSPAALEALCRYPYPGNVRELANLLEQLVVLAPGEVVDLADLPAGVRRAGGEQTAREGEDQWNLPQAVQRLEQELIAKAIRVFGSQREAARHLGINHSTISRKAKKPPQSIVE